MKLAHCATLAAVPNFGNQFITKFRKLGVSRLASG